MSAEREALRDWHRLFGLLLTDFFSGSPFVVEVERDLSQQQQLLDVVIIRRGRGRFVGRSARRVGGPAAAQPDHVQVAPRGAGRLGMQELVGHYVAYRKLVSPSPSDLLAEDQLPAVCGVPPASRTTCRSRSRGSELQPGVYDCRWGTDAVRVVVAGSCRVSRTTHRCTCSAPRRSWLASAAAPTGGARSRRAGCWGSCLIGFGRRALPCHSRWRTSTASTSRNTSRG